MLINKLLINLIILCLLLLISGNNFAQNVTITLIEEENDYVRIFYTLSGDKDKNYNIKFCIKDSSNSSFMLIPKTLKASSIGEGYYAGKPNTNISFSTAQLPEDFEDYKKYYYEIIAEEIIKEINFRDISKISKGAESYINEGVAVIISTKDSIQLFKDYCNRLLKIPYDRIKYEVTSNAFKTNLENIFSNDGWLHNSIKDGISDVVIYFSGKTIISEKNNKIYLLPYDVNTVNGGISFDELISALEGFNPNSITIFIESFLSNGSFNETMPEIYFYPNFKTDKIRVIWACRGNQTNNYIEEEKMGLFTYEIFKGLSGKADLNKDKGITFKELYRFVKENVWNYSVEKLKKEQDPILYPNLEILGENADSILITIDN